MAGYRDYIAWERLPHLWCAGCGHGVILKALALTLAELEIPREKAVLTSGIGCCGRIGDYVSTHRFQGTHGRTLAFATGIHLARPDVKVICVMGDGDAAAIGGNHFIHAARRNIDLTAIIPNNLTYGMTGGQFSPLTPSGSVTSTSRNGKREPAFDICSLAAAAGASYVARSTVYHVTEMQKFLKEAVLKRGFSVLEVLTPCPTYYGRYNALGEAPQMLEWLSQQVIPLAKYRQLPEAEQYRYWWRGRLVDRAAPDFLSRLQGAG